MESAEDMLKTNSHIDMESHMQGATLIQELKALDYSINNAKAKASGRQNAQDQRKLLPF